MAFPASIDSACTAEVPASWENTDARHGEPGRGSVNLRLRAEHGGNSGDVEWRRAPLDPGAARCYADLDHRRGALPVAP